MRTKINALIQAFKNHKKVIENYFFMTVLQVLNSFFYLLIYPYLFRTIGSESYGIFVFATSVSAYFSIIMKFGFDLPGVKAISENRQDIRNMTEIISSVFTAKTYLFLILSPIFLVLLFVVPVFRDYKIVFIASFVMIYSQVIFPQWFFQAIQAMRVVTFVQLGIKVLSLPLIFLFVKNAEDLDTYALIYSGSTLLGGLLAAFVMFKVYGIRLYWAATNKLKRWYQLGLPFFYTSLAASVKEYSIPIIVGSFFGMSEVAIYDLANKIISVPRILFVSINSAIFPKLIVNIKNNIVKKIIKAEIWLSIFTILLIAVFGQWLVKMVSGICILDAYYLSLLLSVTILSWLVVGAYIYFVFMPNNKNYLVTQNQLVALISFFLFSLIGLAVYNNILVFGAAMALSGLLEIVYCIWVTRKYKLL
ncbi:oligosaccharide flippase family protein [Bergeyella zoohelcum]|uniref:O-antigen transporter n=1 Tax=Bergeyella zoohelcum TaxID=1015 RepID=A0A7Z8YQJ9_9FLAO|nr:oligosaccharide flippase family protein [Bergeyella zoohelcum]VDH05088.1 Putative O-antigen transporter [Bergeyella zoohelcum]